VFALRANVQNKIARGARPQLTAPNPKLCEVHSGRKHSFLCESIRSQGDNAMTDQSVEILAIVGAANSKLMRAFAD
jgi:hypothetical protein